MSASEDIVDYIKEVRMVLADSIDVLLNLQHDLQNEITIEKDDEITPVSSKAELVDMTYDIAYDQKIKNAQEEFSRRDIL
ncbi:MAG: hypothetical protein EB150_04645 [Nitrososphaeria archaeon]|nr:hypothetical protein [Nitrososphaeria archaeon]NDB51417.1 hypothetical protein [Nitrosopumilaceae archaeon]NDB87417.1 hypothetical protein [Nitrososphaerota archaeon]NDB46940.1 hypothetical protein [Nitrososphaeria archaeon]NDB63577.1 hypothetical protein [Nitrosopumilaceae archaeon]